jgi:rod shape-determining protein MreC
VYKQTVRRRRAVLALLVALSFALLTAYFSETAGGVLHTLQRGALQVLAPIQEGTGRALKPLRDLAGWFDDTLDARQERDQFRRERDQLRSEVVGLEAARAENQQLRRMVELDRARLSDMQPVTARVIARSPTLWYQRVNIDAGRVDGVRVDQPVVTGDGLVGKVTSVTRGAAQVTLITDHTSGVSARAFAAPAGERNGRGEPVYGLLQSSRNPPDLVLNFVSRRSQLEEGDRVSTAGSRSSRLESLFPPDIPIGVVTDVDEEDLSQYQRVNVRPFAALRRLDFVQVLTGADTAAGAERAQAP